MVIQMFIGQVEPLLHKISASTNTHTNKQTKIRKESFIKSHSNKRMLQCSFLGTKSLFMLEHNIQYIHERAKLKGQI